MCSAGDRCAWPAVCNGSHLVEWVAYAFYLAHLRMCACVRVRICKQMKKRLREIRLRSEYACFLSVHACVRASMFLGGKEKEMNVIRSWWNKNCFAINLFIRFFGFGCAGSSLLHDLFSGSGERGHSPEAVHRLLTAAASLLVGPPGVWASVSAARGLSSCGLWAQSLAGVWNLPRRGTEPTPTALAGGFLSTVPPKKSLSTCF